MESLILLFIIVKYFSFRSLFKRKYQLFLRLEVQFWTSVYFICKQSYFITNRNDVMSAFYSCRIVRGITRIIVILLRCGELSRFNNYGTPRGSLFFRCICSRTYRHDNEVQTFRRMPFRQLDPFQTANHRLAKYGFKMWAHA